jgi:hypothetical protein
MLVQRGFAEDPFGGAVFAFRGRRAGLVKLLWLSGRNGGRTDEGIRLRDQKLGRFFLHRAGHPQITYRWN